EGSLDDLLEFAAVGVTTSGSVEAFVGDHVGAVEDQGGEALPLAFVLDREHYLGAVATRKGPVGGDGGMGRSGSSRAGSAIAGEVERVAHPFDERVKEARRQGGALTCTFAVEQGGEDSRVGIHTGGDVCRRDSRLCGELLCSGHRDQSCFGLHECIVGLCVLVRPVRSVSGDRGMDEARVDRPQISSTEAEALGGAGGEVLDEDIGRSNELMQDLEPVGALEVERQTLLVAVDPHEMAGEPVDRRVVSAGEVTDFWTFDLDDSGAEVGQLPGGELSSDGLLATDYGNSRQRQVLAGDSRYGRLGGRGHRPSTTSCLSRTHTSYISLMIMHYRKAQ